MMSLTGHSRKKLLTTLLPGLSRFYLAIINIQLEKKHKLVQGRQGFEGIGRLCRCELSSGAFNCLSKQMLIIRANVWRLIESLTKLTILFSKAYSIHLHYAIHSTNNVGQSQVFNWVILSQTIQLIQVTETSHDSAEWSCCRKVCAKREVMCKSYLP